jgi:hypothetical protein
LEEGKIVFWAEWEPESEVIEEINNRLTNVPRYIYRPYYVVPSNYKDLQSTDPFVFGERFYYIGCQQVDKNDRANQLRYLEKGSVILFGSCVGQSDFVLDTVFVVAGWIEHSSGDHLMREKDAFQQTPLLR